jgi:branched-chain amino acid transport system ATP-binding protein
VTGASPAGASPAREPILAVEDIYTAYDLSQVLFGVSLEVSRGECVCLLGRNGVGKTTTMRSIIGLTPPRRGRVVWKGRDVTGRAPYQIARAGIGFIPEDRRIFADLTVWENLDVASRGGGNGGWSVERVFDLFPKLRELVGRQGGFLSGGEQQMLTIARTLMGNPELLLLDEPSEGLAPLVVEHLKEQIARLKREGLTILLAEQNVGFSLDLADRVYVLEKGRIRYHGTAREFRDNDAIRQQYLAL